MTVANKYRPHFAAQVSAHRAKRSLFFDKSNPLRPPSVLSSPFVLLDWPLPSGLRSGHRPPVLLFSFPFLFYFAKSLLLLRKPPSSAFFEDLVAAAEKSLATPAACPLHIAVRVAVSSCRASFFIAYVVFTSSQSSEEDCSSGASSPRGFTLATLGGSATSSPLTLYHARRTFRSFGLYHVGATAPSELSLLLTLQPKRSFGCRAMRADARTTTFGRRGCTHTRERAPCR